MSDASFLCFFRCLSFSKEYFQMCPLFRFHIFLFLRGLILSSRYSVFKVRLPAVFSAEWRLRDSNSRPPACKAGALPTELSPHLIRQPPAFPYRLQYSIIGRPGLNHRVRDENGCLPWAHRHRNKLPHFARTAAVKHTAASSKLLRNFLRPP